MIEIRGANLRAQSELDTWITPWSHFQTRDSLRVTSS